MPLLRLKWQGRDYKGYPLWCENRAAYRVECGERVLGVVFGESEAWKLVKSDWVVSLEDAPLEGRSSPKMFKGVAID